MSENEIKLLAALREGCVCHAKRWSGDTHDDLSGSIDQDATDALMLVAASAIDRLTAERDAAVADAASLRERMLTLEAQRDEFLSREWQAEKSRRKAVAAVNIAYRHLDVESLRVSHCKDLAAIEAAMAEAK